MIVKPVTVVIPVYNDLNALREAVPRTITVLEAISSQFEVLIAEDASTDGSQEFACECQKNDPRIRHIHRDQRLGRGSALSYAAEIATGEIFCYFDVDLATDMNHLSDLLQAIDAGYDMAIGSRLLSASNIVRSADREVKSRGYNFLVRLILRSRIHDHQCGFKAFNRSRLLEILPDVQDTHWFWDTEVLVRGQKKGYRISEIPVVWHQGPGTTVKSSDIWQMGRSILRLWWQIHV